MVYMNKGVTMILGAVLFGALMFTTQAQPLLYENWSSGAFDSARWLVNDNDASTSAGEVAIELYSGDYAAYTKGPLVLAVPDDQWDYNYYSKLTWDRGNNLRCTFQVWKDITKISWAGGNVNNVINGPWHNAVSATDPYTTMEAAVGGWGTLPRKFSLTGWNTGNGIPTAMEDAYGASDSRENSIWIRVTLGNTSGGMLEWTTENPLPWVNPGGATWTLAEDLRDGSGGELANNGLMLGFHTHAGGVAVDNIYVEDDTHLIPVELSNFLVE